MRFALVDGSGRFVGPPQVSDGELGRIIGELFANMQRIYLSTEQLTRRLSELESLIGTTGFLVNGQLTGRLSADQAGDLGRRLMELSAGATERIETEPTMKDLVLQLRFLTAQAARRNLALWLLTEG